MNLLSLLPDSFVLKKYIGVGTRLGAHMSYLDYGAEVSQGMLRSFRRWEKEYSNRGFRTIELEKFVRHGGYAESIEDSVGVRIEEGEDIKLYSKQFEE